MSHTGSGNVRKTFTGLFLTILALSKALIAIATPPDFEVRYSVYEVDQVRIPGYQAWDLDRDDFENNLDYYAQEGCLTYKAPDPSGFEGCADPLGYIALCPLPESPTNMVIQAHDLIYSSDYSFIVDGAAIDIQSTSDGNVWRASIKRDSETIPFIHGMKRGFSGTGFNTRITDADNFLIQEVKRTENEWGYFPDYRCSSTVPILDYGYVVNVWSGLGAVEVATERYLSRSLSSFPKIVVLGSPSGRRFTYFPSSLRVVSPFGIGSESAFSVRYTAECEIGIDTDCEDVQHPEEPLELDIEKNLGEDDGGERDPCITVGNPINVITGNKFQKEQDVSGNSAAPLAFIRYYNSKDLGTTALGPNWRHSYERSITFAKKGKGKSAVQIAKLKRQDGKAVTFIDQGLGWATDPDNRYRLEKKGGSWLVRTPDDSVETYNGKGVLVAIADVKGNTQTLSYKKNQLTVVTSNSGERLEFLYDPAGLLVGIDYSAADQDPVLGESRTWAYGYANGRLVSVTNPDGRQRNYHYEDLNFPNALTGITDERSVRYATWDYDARGNATASHHGFGAERIDIDYNINGERTVTDSLGNRTDYAAIAQLGKGKITDTNGPTCSTGDSAVAAYEYDPATNNVLSRTIDGVTTLWGNYDAKGNPGLEVEAAVTGVERRTSYTYDPRFQSKITTITEDSVYPGGNKVTTLVYDNFGNLIRRTEAGHTPTGAPVSRTTEFEYNGPYRQLSAIDGPRTDVADITTFEYYPDDPDLYQHQGMLLRVTNAEGIVLRDNLHYNALRQLVSETRPNGLHLSYEWEPNTDRLASVTETAGGSSRTTRWTYLPTGDVETLTPPDGNTLSFAYDEARRLERITDIDGNYIHYTLDSEGNATEEAIYADSGSLRQSISRSFDVYNRLDVVSQANEAVDHDFAPDGTLRKEVNGKGVETRYDYDELKRLTAALMDANGSDPSTANAEILYGYDPQDGLTEVTAPNNAQTRQEYDDLGNLVSLSSPDTGTANHQYDSAGNRVQTTDAKGHTFSYDYDALNRLLGVDAPGNDHDLSYG